MLASGVPALKSETVVSVKVAEGVVKLADAGGSGDVLELGTGVTASADVTR